MPIILISGPPHGVGEELAQRLEEKTGWPLLSRNELVEQARDEGIKLGRLETSIVKSPVIHEKLASEKELYLAFATATLCEMAQDGNLIYYGRAGHFLLPGVSHRLRIGLMVPPGVRVKNVMRDLNLSQEKAMLYLRELDADIDKWVRYVHREETFKDPGQYDVFVNFQNMSLPNAAVLLLEMADFPDFRPTPTSLKRMEDLHLAARAKLRLGADERTHGLDLGVRAAGGVITVTYMPRQEAAPETISEVLQDLEGCRENLCTLAETNLLWVQEAFDPKSEAFKQITRLAQRWGAAVELLRLVPEGSPNNDSNHTVQTPNLQSRIGPKTKADTGGVEEDEPEPPADDGGLFQTLEELVAIGRSAGSHTIFGGTASVLEAIGGNSHYSLVIIGDVFLSKGSEAKKRQVRELALTIRERLKAPVITAEELQSRFLFGKKQAVRLLLFLLAATCIYAFIFSFQDPILRFLGGDIHDKWKWLASLGVALFVPTVAYIYGTVTGLLLKLIDID